jgi:N-alpha-acetyl-L-2,4-diaminobutyrate deacetylase
MTDSRISTDLDFERDGRQVGYLNVPNSTNESGWGTLLMPIAVVKNSRGPTILFTGGNHGDEYEGPVALMKLLRALEPAQVKGRVIILPGLNMPALLAGQRLSPIDGMNMNRAFPGARGGTITAMIAHYVQTALLPRADIVCDIHSGGRSMTFLPSVVVHKLDDPELMRRTLGAAAAFGAPVALVLKELDSAGMLDTAVEQMGRLFISTELGGAGVLSPATVKIADIGVRNLLAHFGICDEPIVTRAEQGLAPTRIMAVPDGDCYAATAESGLYEPFVEVGETVEKGQLLGQVHDIERPGEPPAEKRAKRDGLLVCRLGPGRVRRGDTIAVIAVDR